MSETQPIATTPPGPISSSGIDSGVNSITIDNELHTAKVANGHVRNSSSHVFGQDTKINSLSPEKAQTNVLLTESLSDKSVTVVDIKNDSTFFSAIRDCIRDFVSKHSYLTYGGGGGISGGAIAVGIGALCLLIPGVNVAAAILLGSAAATGTLLGGGYGLYLAYKAIQARRTLSPARPTTQPQPIVKQRTKNSANTLQAQITYEDSQTPSAPMEEPSIDEVNVDGIQSSDEQQLEGSVSRSIEGETEATTPSPVIKRSTNEIALQQKQTTTPQSDVNHHKTLTEQFQVPSIGEDAERTQGVNSKLEETNGEAAASGPLGNEQLIDDEQELDEFDQFDQFVSNLDTDIEEATENAVEIFNNKNLHCGFASKLSDEINVARDTSDANGISQLMTREFATARITYNDQAITTPQEFTKELGHDASVVSSVLHRGMFDLATEELKSNKNQRENPLLNDSFMGVIHPPNPRELYEEIIANSKATSAQAATNDEASLSYELYRKSPQEPYHFEATCRVPLQELRFKKWLGKPVNSTQFTDEGESYYQMVLKGEIDPSNKQPVKLTKGYPQIDLVAKLLDDETLFRNVDVIDLYASQKQRQKQKQKR